MKRSKKIVLAGTAYDGSQEMGTEGTFKQLPEDQLQSPALPSLPVTPGSQDMGTEGTFRQLPEDQLQLPPLPPLPVTPERTFRVPGIGTFFKRKKSLNISEVPPPVSEPEEVPYGFETSRPELEDWKEEYPLWREINAEPELQEEHFKHLKTKYGFHFGKIIGKGSYGTVYKVKQTLSDGTKRKLACKVSSLENFQIRGSVEHAVKTLNREADIYERLDHPNVVKRVDVIHFFDRFTDFSPPIHILIFMELMEGSLHDLIYSSREWRLSERETQNWVKQVVEGLVYLHGNRICHLDIKPGNILYSTIPDSSPDAISGKVYTFKLTDFGLSHKFAVGKPMISFGAVGTKKYKAPEMGPNSPYQAPKADVYSLGISILVSLCGKDMTYQELRDRCASRDPSLEVSQELAELVVAMTEVDPSSRFSLAQVHQHPWIRDMFKAYDHSYYATTRL